MISTGLGQAERERHGTCSLQGKTMSSGDDPSPRPAPPLFRPIHDRILRWVVGFGLFFGGTFLLSLWIDWRETRVEQIALTPEQPIPFSHKHHAGDLGIDCRYCHTGVEKSAFAGLPSSRTCMTCHSQIWKDAPILSLLRESAATEKPIPWKRVNVLPDFVYFNHGAHVTRGVSCVSCHGDVGTMPQIYQVHKFDMGWCLTCHRNPDPRLVPPSAVTDPKIDGAKEKQGWAACPIRYLAPDQKNRLPNCSTCHR